MTLRILSDTLSGEAMRRWVNESNPWQEELRNFVRAFSGAYLLAIPLLYTMEMWWLGAHLSLQRLTAVLAFTFLANIGLAYAGGFKRWGKAPPASPSFGEVIDQAIDALAVGIVASVVVLLVLNRIDFADPLHTLIGKVVIQVMPLSLGAAAANVMFGRGESRSGGGNSAPPGGDGGDDGAGRRNGQGSAEQGGAESGRGRAGQVEQVEGSTDGAKVGGATGQGGPREGGDTGNNEDGGEGDQRDRRSSGWGAAINDIGATATGGAFLGFSIAPTQEVPMLTGGMSLWHLIALVCFTLVVTYLVVFASGFDPEQVSPQDQGLFQRPVTETALAYLVSLGVSAGALFVFGHASLDDPLSSILAMTLVLGLPTAIGGAAGRLVV